MRILFKHDRIEIWTEKKPIGWKVWTLYFNPIEQLRQLIRIEINDFLLSKKGVIKKWLKQ